MQSNSLQFFTLPKPCQSLTNSASGRTISVPIRLNLIRTQYGVSTDLTRSWYGLGTDLVRTWYVPDNLQHILKCNRIVTRVSLSRNKNTAPLSLKRNKV